MNKRGGNNSARSGRAPSSRGNSPADSTNRSSVTERRISTPPLSDGKTDAVKTMTRILPGKSSSSKDATKNAPDRSAPSKSFSENSPGKTRPVVKSLAKSPPGRPTDKFIAKSTLEKSPTKTKATNAPGKISLLSKSIESGKSNAPRKSNALDKSNISGKSNVPGKRNMQGKSDTPGKMNKSGKQNMQGKSNTPEKINAHGKGNLLVKNKESEKSKFPGKRNAIENKSSVGKKSSKKALEKASPAKKNEVIKPADSKSAYKAETGMGLKMGGKGSASSTPRGKKGKVEKLSPEEQHAQQLNMWLNFSAWMFGIKIGLKRPDPPYFIEVERKLIAEREQKQREDEINKIRCKELENWCLMSRHHEIEIQQRRKELDKRRMRQALEMDARLQQRLNKLEEERLRKQHSRQLELHKRRMQEVREEEEYVRQERRRRQDKERLVRILAKGEAQGMLLV